jgi:uncharacterized SAM-binding protein YcdF (DUF218 family)
VATTLWFWLWSIPLMAWCLSRPLEGAYPSISAESAPSADAIVILGGGAACATNGILPYPDLTHSADRVWHGVRLYRAGKAPRIIATGRDTTISALPLLLDFGVPPDAITCIDGARNTEEESQRVAALLPPGTPILLVTSAAHMRRSELLFGHAGLTVLPSPTDHETTVRCADGFAANWLCPDIGVFFTTCGLFKELYADWAYRHIRGFRPNPSPQSPLAP